MTRDWSKSAGDGLGQNRGGGSSVFEPLVRGGSTHRGGSSCFLTRISTYLVRHPVFLTGIGTYLEQSTAEVALSSSKGRKIFESWLKNYNRLVVNRDDNFTYSVL